MYNKDLPSGCHFGTKLQVKFGKIYKTKGNCCYVNDTYYITDVYTIPIESLELHKTYLIYLTFYNHQWWIYDLLKLE